MSSRSRRSAAGPVLALVLALALGALVAAASEAARRRPPSAQATALPIVADESTAAAHEMINELKGLYGGDDSYALIDGFRYDITFTIPGPEGAPVRSWTEAHYIWMQGPPRARIDVDEDSTIVIVSGDTTRVRRAGAWINDPVLVKAARAQALDALWTWHLPRNLANPAIRARQLDPTVNGQPFTTRFFYDHPGLERPPGTVLSVTFAPPTYAMRRLHWFDPRAKAWYLLELADDKKRYGFTWAERRTLHASDAAGEAGPVLWTAVVEDFQIEGHMPTIVLSPPDAGIGVVAARAAADTIARR